jgi:hypothetical protein
MPEPAVEHSLVSRIEVRNECSYISVLPILLCLHDAHRDYFLLHFKYLSSRLLGLAHEDSFYFDSFYTSTLTDLTLTFLAHSQNCEKRQLALLFLSVCPYCLCVCLRGSHLKDFSDIRYLRIF